MGSRWTHGVGCLLLVLTLAYTDASAQFITGGGTLIGKDTLAVRKCGRDGSDVALVTAFSDDGTWSAWMNGIDLYTGGYVPIGESGRKFDVDFGGSSLADFIHGIENGAGELCQTSVTAMSQEKSKFTLKLNRKRTKGKIILKYRFAGVAAGQYGRGKYSLKVEGVWAQ